MSGFMIGVGCGFLCAAFVTAIAPGWLGLAVAGTANLVGVAVGTLIRNYRRRGIEVET